MKVTVVYKRTQNAPADFKSIFKIYSPFVLALIILQPLLYATAAYSHGGGLNNDGCHHNTKTGNYHCHSGNKPEQDFSNLHKERSESFFNIRLAEALEGKTETKYKYDFGLGGASLESAFIKVDVETAEFVIEGGTDKRSSLDSVQQAVFSSVISGKRPAVAIYDTDGKWGKYEYRIWLVAQELGIKFIWFYNGEVINIEAASGGEPSFKKTLPPRD